MYYTAWNSLSCENHPNVQTLGHREIQARKGYREVVWSNCTHEKLGGSGSLLEECIVYVLVVNRSKPLKESTSVTGFKQEDWLAPSELRCAYWTIYWETVARCVPHGLILKKANTAVQMPIGELGRVVDVVLCPLLSMQPVYLISVNRAHLAPREQEHMIAPLFHMYPLLLHRRPCVFLCWAVFPNPRDPHCC